MGGFIHEVTGIIWLVLAVLHNILNLGWYKGLRKGKYSKKRVLMITINILLLVDLIVLSISSIMISKELFPFVGGSFTAVAREAHIIAVVIGFALLVAHVGMHVYLHYKGRKQKGLIALIMVLLVGVVAFGAFGLPYLKRHLKAVHVNLEQAIQGEKVTLNAKKILTVYFTRVGNTDFDSDVNAVSGASLMIDDASEGQERVLMGNAELLAKMIQDAVGGDISAIQVEERYPSGYLDTAKAADKELKEKKSSKLTSKVENIEQYDMVFLVYPLWWNTIPMPVASFLEENDLSNAKLIPVATQGSSGFGTSIQEIKDKTKANVDENELSIYCDDVPNARGNITKWLKTLSE